MAIDIQPTNNQNNKKKCNLQICWKLRRYSVHANATHPQTNEERKWANRTRSKHDILWKWKQRKNKCFLSTSWRLPDLNGMKSMWRTTMQTLQQILRGPKKIDNLLRGGKINVNIKKSTEKKQQNRSAQSRVWKQHIYSKIDSELRLVWKRSHSQCV